MIGSEQQMREEGNLKDKLVIPDAKLTPHLLKAESELKRLLGSAFYAAIEEENSSDASVIAAFDAAVAKGFTGTVEEWLESCYNDCSRAESNLALSYAIYPLNMETSGNGIVGSTGWDSNRRDLLRPGDLDSLVNYFRQIAVNLISPYIRPDLPTDDTVEPPDNLSYGGLSMGAV